LKKNITEIHGDTKGEQPLLGLAIIVKDGGQLFSALLDECQPWVDEIVVGDTGSTDGSIEVAHSHGARVIPVTWEDSFSAARNAVLKQCRAQWILVLDADEKISPDDWQHLRAWVMEISQQKIVPVVRLESRDYLPARHGSHHWQPVPSVDAHQLPGGPPAAGFVSHLQIRLFPNEKNIRFNDCLHETVNFSVMEANLAVVDHPALIHHFGKLIPNHSRDELHLKLARTKTGKQPHNPAAWSTLANCALACEQNQEALSALDRALILDPGNINLRLLAGRVLKECGMLEQANLQLNAVAGSASTTDRQLADSCHLRAEVALVRGQLERVSHLLGVALRLCPDNGHYFQTLARWHQEEGRADAARSALNKASELWGERDLQKIPL